MTITDFENGFKHIASNIITNLEQDVKDLASIVQKEWPDLEDLITSGKVGEDILQALKLLGPVSSIISLMFPQFQPLFGWAESILKQLAALQVFNTPCTCSACSAS
jgi:hypothetical protein